MSHTLRFRTQRDDSLYHCISRTVNGEVLFDDHAKAMLQKHLRQAAEFSGVQIITYAIMSNHFHVLVRLPAQRQVGDEELLRRYKILHPVPSKWIQGQVEIIEATLAAGGEAAKALREKLLKRMGDISEFMKTFKQRFSLWFNDHHNRFGPVWSERFTSTIIEARRHSGMLTVAAYIDLNPVRAGLVQDPKDYRFSGYGEAVAIGGAQLDGIRQIFDCNRERHSDAEVLAQYRLVLYGKGAAPKRGSPNSPKLRRKDSEAVAAANGTLTDAELLRTRQNWFSRGGIIGSRDFVIALQRDYQTLTRRRNGIVPVPFPTPSGHPPSTLYSMRRRE